VIIAAARQVVENYQEGEDEEMEQADALKKEV
jgi:hypothetical protein